MKEHLRNDDLLDFLHEALSPEADAAIYAHLEECTACRKQHDFEAALTEAVQAYAVREERELPSTVKAEIWERVRSAKPSPLSWVAGWLRPGVAIPVAAVIVLGAYFGVSSMGPRGVASIDAAYYLQDHAALNSTIPFSDRSSITPVDIENGTAIDTTQQTAVNVEAASYTVDATQ